MDLKKDDLICCLKEQISEISLLRSMYAEPEELEFSDDFDLDYLNCYIENLVDVPPASNEFCVKISAKAKPVEITFYLPLKYPKFQQLNAFVRSNSIKNRTLIEINSDLRQYLIDSSLGEPKIFDCLTWIKEKITENEFADSENGPSSSAKCDQKKIIFERYWIYSHHICSKFKRRNLLNLSHQLNLTGFSVPGKPGIICVEGAAEDCLEFWDSIKMWSWKQIVLRHREKSETEDAITSTAWRKFESFKEMPLDGIKIFLQEHNCCYAFSILFGFGDKAEND